MHDTHTLPIRETPKFGQRDVVAMQSADDQTKISLRDDDDDGREPF